MPEFADTQKQFNEWRRSKTVAELSLHQTRERLRKIEAQRSTLARVFDPDSDAHGARHSELDAQAAKLESSIAKMDGELSQLRDREVALLDTFDRFSDPRINLPQLDATLPILLFPVRLETRFKTVTDDGGQVDELWVRIYPDDCLVDTFEATVSESEASSLRRFWINWTKAGGVADQQRGAWRGLVGGFGSGRAAWLYRQTSHRPAALDALPSKSEPHDVLLVIPLEMDLPETERNALRSYWTTVWRSADDRAAQQSALEALQAAVGAARTAELVEAFKPANIDEQPLPPFQRADVTVDLVFLEFAPLAEQTTQQQTWTQAPSAHLLPERFVLLGYRDDSNVLNEIGRRIPSSLVLGPNPSAPAGEQLRHENGELVIPDDMRWMVDFDTAVQVGMGFRVRLSADDLARGYDQLMVLGARILSDAEEAKSELETLIQHHQDGTAGFSLLSTGTATNNTETDGSGFSESEDSDTSFDLILGKPEPLVATDDLMTRLDGQWFADTLGIDLNILNHTAHSRGRDQCEARAMNTVLWPGTLGYVMESLMAPVFDEDTIARSRWFLTHFVTGRGTTPAVRIGEQPYAILPATRLSAMTWLNSERWQPPKTIAHPPGSRSFLRDLSGVLAKIRQDWATMAEDVEHAAKTGGDPHQRLLDILGLNPASVEFHHRYADSLEDIWNRLTFRHLFPAVQLLTALAPETAMALLARLGYGDDTVPEILEKVFFDSPNPLDGPSVDDVLPLSESATVRAYTTDGRNYLQWLIDAAETSFETLRTQDGFNNNPPQALLYLLLRYALQQGYWDASLRLHLESGILTTAQVAAARIEPSFVHVAPTAGNPENTIRAPDDRNAGRNKPIYFDRASESRYHYLYAKEPQITGSDEEIARFIPHAIGRSAATRYLDDQLKALKHLVGTPTARLERLLAEHLDLCTYRLDAWRWGLLHYQISVIRETRSSDDSHTRSGIYLGAFGWLENVKSENKQLMPIELPDTVRSSFTSPNEAPLMEDSTNQGYIHAPSLNQAITAAILRNGYLSNATETEPDTLAVNLSSNRVRQALSIIEGLRNGQSLGALLGYRLERGLHDRHSFAEVDEFIFELRRAFPLVANRNSDTQAPADEPIESVEAQNVVDGLALADHIRNTGNRTYPFGKTLKPVDNPDQETAINTEVEHLLNLHDALADLAMAEGVYQAILGNYERTGATLNAYSEGGFPPEPEVIQTPRSGINITHRVALQLESGLDGTVSPNSLPVTPRTRCEPAINKWLATHLPDANDVACRVSYVDPVTETETTVDVTQAELELQPLDLLYLVNPETDQAMSALDDRIRHYVMINENLRPDVDVRISYMHRYPDKYSLFELGSLLRALRRLVLRSRPLRATDMTLQNEAARKDDQRSISLDDVRIRDPLVALTNIHQAEASDDLTDLANDMASPLGDPETNHEAVVTTAETWAARYITLALKTIPFGIPQSGIGSVYERRRTAYTAVVGKLDALLARWQTRLNDFDAAIAEIAVLPTDEEKFAQLRQAERLVTRLFTTPQPTTPADYQTLLDGIRTTFAGKRSLFAGIRGALPDSVTALIAVIETASQSAPPIEEFDRDGIDLTEDRNLLVQLAVAVQNHVTSLAKEIGKRRDACQAALNNADAATSSVRTVEHRTQAAKALFGDDFVIVPEFVLPPEAGDELTNVWSDRDALLQYLMADPPSGRGIDFPVDDWLYGVARVREKMALWEQVILASEMVNKTAPELTPLQLPFRADDRWLALEHPEDYDYEGERLLYTAHFSVSFDKTRPQCGLLIDEWTEVIPSKEETTGLAFHYDRPSTEPPQAWLLALSPSMEGGWQWDDLIACVRETFDEARLRAVEPTQIDRTPYARFLPAAIMAATRHPITIDLNLAENNGLYAFTSEPPDG